MTKVMEIVAGTVLLTGLLVLGSKILGDLSAILFSRVTKRFPPQSGANVGEPKTIGARLDYVHQRRMEQVSNSWRIQAEAFYEVFKRNY